MACGNQVLLLKHHIREQKLVNWVPRDQTNKFLARLFQLYLMPSITILRGGTGLPSETAQPPRLDPEPCYFCVTIWLSSIQGQEDKNVNVGK